MRIHVAVATTGRAGVVRQTVDRLESQSRLPDDILVVGASPEDVAGVAGRAPKLEVFLAPRGLCKQRNAALDHLAGRSDILVFFDDDFVPADDYLAKLERLMAEQPAVVGATGRLVGDGICTGGIGFGEAVDRLDVRGERPSAASHRCSSLYGCNMAIRLSAVGTLRFDEALPLYGWQEDVDFTRQLGRRGILVKSGMLTGIHLGTPGGRTSGRRLGYSQVANIIYLGRKGTIPAARGGWQMLRNILSNLLHSLWPDPRIDHRGRLAGNLMAFGDLLRVRVDPRRVEYL